MSALRDLGWVLSGLVMLVGSGCAVEEKVFARVGDHEVEIDALQTYLGAVTGEAWEAVDERAAARLLDQYLDQEVVAAAALIRGDVRLPEEPAERSAAVRALLREVCGPTPQVDPQELEEEVARRCEEVRSARARVRQLLLVSAEQAQAVRQRLDDGEDFMALSREISRVPNAASGGELGYLEQGSLPPELDEVIFALEPGEISQPVQGPAGYHIFQVLEVVPEGPARREEIVETVSREMRQRLARECTRDCVGRLALEVGVQVFEDHLWFRYDGRYAEAGDDAL